jgi:hypothetical protein
VTTLKWILVLVLLLTVLTLCKVGARFALNVPLALKSFWTHPMELLSDVGHVESRFGLFGDGVSVSAR